MSVHPPAPSHTERPASASLPVFTVTQFINAALDLYEREEYIHSTVNPNPNTQAFLCIGCLRRSFHRTDCGSVSGLLGRQVPLADTDSVPRPSTAGRSHIEASVDASLGQPRPGLGDFPDEDSEYDPDDISCFEFVTPPLRIPPPHSASADSPSGSNTPPTSVANSASIFVPPVCITSPSPPSTPTPTCSITPAPPYSPYRAHLVNVAQGSWVAPHVVHPEVIVGIVAEAPAGPFSPDWDVRVPWIPPDNAQCLSWFVVTVGRRVVSSADAVNATSGVSRNIFRGGYQTHADAVADFEHQLGSGMGLFFGLVQR
ncbi:hypothetical protein PYCCODRAFT_1428964 [Trametes coccinea BRFM310]|uniref:Uncharacterized protein n=1 Tax=Trametes coccinea (strain BRFM310) TaxID=1353009 RepID=A0A1Y2I677_TRAC3|nr:hypothetical protein PYCCODRAFT_1428964 [Trametes coccinea BRFM310]